MRGYDDNGGLLKYDPARRVAWKTVCVVALLAGFVTMVFYDRIDIKDPAWAYSDWRVYNVMARDAPDLNPRAPIPFAYRPLGPWLAGIIPGPREPSFFALSAIAVTATPVLFFVLLVRMKVPQKAAAMAVILFIFNKYLFGFNAWDHYRLSDSIAGLLILIAFMAMYESRWLVFGLALLVGSATRESVMIMAPVALVLALGRRDDKADIVKLCIAMVPAVALFASIRLALPHGKGQGLLQALMVYGPAKLASPASWLRTLVNPFVPFSLFPLIFPRQAWAVLRKPELAIFLGLVLFSNLFGCNHERLMIPAFIVFYLFIGLVMDKFFIDDCALTTLIIAIVIMASLHHYFTNIGLPSRNFTIILSLVSLAAATMTALAARILARKKALPRNASA